LLKVKYILGAAVLAGLIASGYCSADPVGPLLLALALLAGAILALRRWPRGAKAPA
jgi:MYXO-CTERM domain-containing protein